MLREQVCSEHYSQPLPAIPEMGFPNPSAATVHPTLAPAKGHASTAVDSEGGLPAEPVCTQASRLTRKPFTVKRFRCIQAASPEVALLVSTYHKPWHLVRVLQSIAAQQGSCGLFEVVVTDDGSTDETHRIIEEFARSVQFPVTLTTHPHAAFQLARCRNEGAIASTAPYLLLLDGDCVLPRDHVLIHLQRRHHGHAMCGYCARLDKATSERPDTDAIWSTEHARWMPRPQARALAKRDRKARFYRLIRHPRKPELTGGNCAVWRTDFENVNGFDENFEGWGGEDTDLGRRLRRAGVQIESILKYTHTYHLWHTPDVTAPQRIRDGVNHPYFERGFRFTRCMNGLVTRLLEQVAFAIVGEPDHPKRANAFLEACGLSISTGNPDRVTGPREIEFLFLPGKGEFSGQADCNVLIVLEDCHRVMRVARKAHLLVADTNYRHGLPGYFFKLADFRHALDKMAG